MSSFDPTKEDRFTFGLWTVGNPGRDPFGPSVRPTLNPNHIARKSAECAAAGVTLLEIPLAALVAGKVALAGKLLLAKAYLDERNKNRRDKSSYFSVKLKRIKFGL